MWRTEVDPADDTGDAFIAIGEIEKKESFVFGLIGLDGDGCVNVMDVEFAREVRGEIVALEDGHVIGDPGIADAIVFPEMLVGVDDHGSRARFVSGLIC